MMNYEVDAHILMNPKVWEASGHLTDFSNPLVDCKECKTRHRADNLIQDYDPSVNADAMSQEEIISNFTFRTIEFGQMEFQTFCKEGSDSEFYRYFKEYGIEFFESFGLLSEKISFHDYEELAHYAKKACEIE